MKIKIICKHCNEEFETYNKNQQFCSKKCYYEWFSMHKTKRTDLWDVAIKKHEKHLGVDSFQEWLDQKYTIERKSIREIMAELDTKSNQTIMKAMKLYNIKVRHGGEAIATQWENNDERRKKQADFLREVSSGSTGCRLDEEELRERLLLADKILIDRKVENRRSLILSRCSICGKETWQELGNYKKCPGCNESKGEKAVARYCKQNNLMFAKQYTDPKCRYKSMLRFDFAIFSNHELVCLIEYQGAQHYEPVPVFGGEEAFEINKKRDGIKKEFCRKNKIPLIEIPYWEKDINKYLCAKLDGLNQQIQLVMC